MTFDELFRMAQATLLVLTFSGMCWTIADRVQRPTLFYISVMYLTFWLVAGTLWRLKLGTDLAWTNFGFFTGVIAVCLTTWRRALEEGPNPRTSRRRGPRLNRDDLAIRHDNPGVTMLSEDDTNPRHREPRLDANDYDSGPPD